MQTAKTGRCFSLACCIQQWYFCILKQSRDAIQGCFEKRAGFPFSWLHWWAAVAKLWNMAALLWYIDVLTLTSGICCGNWLRLFDVPIALDRHGRARKSEPDLTVPWISESLEQKAAEQAEKLGRASMAQEWLKSSMFMRSATRWVTWNNGWYLHNDLLPPLSQSGLPWFRCHISCETWSLEALCLVCHQCIKDCQQIAELATRMRRASILAVAPHHTAASDITPSPLIYMFTIAAGFYSTVLFPVEELFYTVYLCSYCISTLDDCLYYISTVMAITFHLSHGYLHTFQEAFGAFLKTFLNFEKTLILLKGKWLGMKNISEPEDFQSFLNFLDC